jgi:hypothetical protein
LALKHVLFPPPPPSAQEVVFKFALVTVLSSENMTKPVAATIQEEVEAICIMIIITAVPEEDESLVQKH